MRRPDLRLLTLLLAALACGTDTGTGGNPATGDGASTQDVASPTADTSPGPGRDITAPDIDEDAFALVAVAPAVGATKGGDVVTIIGSGFVDGEMAVFFGPSLATNVFVVSKTRLVCTTPPAEPGAVDVRVARPSFGQEATLEGGFLYQSPIRVDAVEPDEGHATGGTPVVVSGSGFSRGVGKVLFGGRAAIGVVVVDDQTLQLTTPPGASGLTDVRVTTATGGAELRDGFLYFDSPRIDAATPGVGPEAGGTEVVLDGAGFTADSVVRFGGVTAVKATVESPTRIAAVAPPGTGSVDITVAGSRGLATLSPGFVYRDDAASLALLLAQPDNGTVAGGTQVALVVSGLPADAKVRFDGVAANVLAVEPAKSRVLVVTPPGDEGPADVAVETSLGNVVRAAAFTYTAAFDVLQVTPPGGPEAGGTAITVQGHGFTDGVSVRVGALPCTAVSVQDPQTLTCVTPPGSPGAADVRVLRDGAEAVLPNGYTFVPPDLGLFAISPDRGAQAGGTFVSLLGAGFVPGQPVTVQFGGAQATHVTVVSPTLITCRTPPGPVSTVDVVVKGPGAPSILPGAYTYFDPLSMFGGTWGTEVDGAVNITVIDTSGAPLADAYTILAVDADTPYQGYTNAAGQITFSGPDVLGTQMVSASKPGFESASVIRFDATNITLALKPIPVPSSGPPPPGATVSGRVFGLGKYVVIPDADCDFKIQADGQCQPCVADLDCPGTAPTCTPIGAESACTAACTADSDCLTGFACMAVAGLSEGQCVPAPGKRQARCYTSMGSIFSPLPTANAEAAGIVADDGTYEIGAPLGEIAVICLGGFVDETNPDVTLNFTPTAAGVARHLVIAPGPNPGNDITLNHPLTRTLTVRLDDPQYAPDLALEYTAALVFWNFGSDGGFMHRAFQDIGYLGFDDPVLQVPAQPESFSGDLYDARFEVLGINLALQDDGTQLPASFTYLKDVDEFETGAEYRYVDGGWETTTGAVGVTVHDIAGLQLGDLWAVGERGALLHAKAGAWALQASPTKQTLYGAWAASDTDVWAVGDAGTLLRFNGVTWSVVPLGASEWDELRAVHGASPTDVWIAGGGWSGFWHWDGAAFTRNYSGSGDLRDVHYRDGLWVAVGHYGAIRHLENGVWVPKMGPDTDTDLEAVHVVSAVEAYAVGAGGAIWRWDGTSWTAMASPTRRTLREVVALGAQNVIAVGDAATRLHFDGNAWTDQTSGAAAYTALLALWGGAGTQDAVALGANEVLLGPMLRVPQNQTPEDGGVLVGEHIAFDVDPSGVPAHFNYVTVTIPTMFGETPVWSITTDGDVHDFTLPDFENLEGTPGIAAGTTYILRIIRVFKDDFTIDNYDFGDLDTSRWRSWAIDATTFTK